MSTLINVPIFGNQTLSASGGYAVTLGAVSAITVQRDATTPVNDPVDVTFDTLTVGLASSIAVQNASLTLDAFVGINALTTFYIGNGGRLDLSDTLNLAVGSPINFTGVGGILVLDNDPNIRLLSSINGFNNDDVFAFHDVPVATSASYSGGVLTVFNGQTAVASVAVNGSFDASQLGVQSDGKGGVHVGVGLGNGGGLANDIYATGLHTEYALARTGLGQLYLDDKIGGRDNFSPIADAKYVLFADGVGRFDATGVALDVAHVYQAAFDRRPDAGGLEYWTQLVEAGVLTEKQVALGFTGTAEFAANYGGTDNLAYVAKLYDNVLGRAGEQSGINFWTGQLAEGAARSDVLFSFANSFENVHNSIRTTGDAEYGTAYRLYEAALNRAPDLPGLSYWYGQLEAGIATRDVSKGFVDSNEFLTNYGNLDNANFVERLYNNVLDRGSDVAGSQYWQGQLANGATKADVLLGFSESLENRVQTADATHDNWIFLGYS